MKKIVHLFFAFVITLSCSESGEPKVFDSGDLQETDELNDEEILEEERVDPIIDISDISQLPADTGGTHIAFPHGSTIAVFGHYIYTPRANILMMVPNTLYFYFCTGGEERGNSRVDAAELDKVLSHGPPRLIKENQWNPAHLYIIASPQLIFNYWDADQIHLFIKYLIDNYQINANGIYITGLSLGGSGCWYYVGTNGTENYAAAIVPICGSGHSSLIENLKNTRIWAFHGAPDQVVRAFDQYGSVPMVNAINVSDPAVTAKVTIYPGAGHDS